MKTSVSGLLLASVLAAAIQAQEEQKPAAPQESTKESQATVKELIQKLGDSDYQARRDAESGLRARGKDVLDALKQAAESHTDEEVRWRARRLARQIEQGDAAGGLRRRAERERAVEPQIELQTEPMLRWGAPQDLDQMFNQMFERMERQFGIDIPRQRFFHNDFFRDLERQFDDVQKQGKGQAMEMKIGPGGVKVQVQERGQDGKVETKTYEAPDIKAFREKYPDVARRFLDGNSMRFDFGTPRFRTWTVPEQQPRVLWPQDLDRAPDQADQVPPANERLGVTIEDVGDELREYLQLDEGVGLRVTDVAEDSLAQKLGVQRGDVVTKIADKAIHDRGDVREALRAIPAGKKVEVVVYRKGSPLTLSAEKPGEAKPSDQPKELKKKKAEIR